MNGLDAAQKVGQDGLNRTMQSFGALSRGWQTLATETAGFSRKSFEQGTTHVETLMGFKSVDAAVRAQTDFVKSSYEQALGQAARFGELYLDLVKETAKPFEGFVPAVAK